MKKYAILLFFFELLLQQVSAQTIAPKWESCFGGTEFDEGRGIVFANQSYWIVAGTNSTDGDISYNHGSDDIWLLNVDGEGNLISEKTFGGTNADGAFIDILSLNDSVFYITGRTKSIDGDIGENPWPGGGGNYWALKIDKQGQIIWERVFGGSKIEAPCDMYITDDEGIVVLGLSNSEDGNISHYYGGYDLWMVKLDRDGNMLWEKSLGGGGSESFGSIIQTIDMGYIVVAATDGGYGGNFDTTCNYHGQLGGWDFSDAWIVKMDSNRTIEWQQCYGGKYDESATNILEIETGYIVLAHTMSNDGDVSGLNGPPGPNSEYGGDIWVFKIDKEGNLLWQNCLGGTYNEYARNIFETSDKGFMIIGETGSDDGDVEGYHGIDTGIYDDIWLAKIDSLGNLDWQYCYGGGGRELMYRGVAQHGDFDYVITLGTDTDAWQCGGQMWSDLRVVRLADSLVSVDENYKEETESFSICPNPAKNKVKLSIEPAKSQKIKVYDMAGQAVLEQTVSQESLSLDISNWPPGLYLFTLIESGKMVQTEKVLVK